ncbi:uncharacterized protein LOC134820044 [Bolinopsis microptera]|uniref:uncharacterized protein LOC134820044 n=1 Tax=Bolinopsis microptera TaxID=2820187 RepID=UPI00307A418B
MKLWHVTLFLVVCLTLSEAGKKKKKNKEETKTDKKNAKCEKRVGRFDQCLSLGYQPIHYKSCQDLSIELEGKKKKTCKRLEMSIKKRCSYTCQPMLGGITELSVDDKDAIEAADIGLRELRDRAVRQGTLDEDSAFVRGEIVRARYQVVAGERFMITMKLGVTDKTECAAAAKDRIVSFSDCSHEENMGTYYFSFVRASWKMPQYYFEEFQDIDGPGLKTKYWERDFTDNSR